jgi:hypothetical protein
MYDCACGWSLCARSSRYTRTAGLALGPESQQCVVRRCDWKDSLDRTGTSSAYSAEQTPELQCARQNTGQSTTTHSSSRASHTSTHWGGCSLMFWYLRSPGSTRSGLRRAVLLALPSALRSKTTFQPESTGIPRHRSPTSAALLAAFDLNRVQPSVE